MDKREYELRKSVAEEIGMIFSGDNLDGEPEFIGTSEKWNQFEKLLEEKLETAYWNS